MGQRGRDKRPRSPKLGRLQPGYHKPSRWDAIPGALDRVAQLRDAQQGRCAICFRGEGMRPALYVDHDHTTQEIRGLLCVSCNTALGLLGDNPNALRRAADYIEASKEAHAAQQLTQQLNGMQVANGRRTEAKSS